MVVVVVVVVAVVVVVVNVILLLQSILNAASQLVFSATRSERITPLLRDLHWLRSRNGFNSISAFWHSDVSMDQRRHISLRAFVRQPMWKVVATSSLLPP